MTRKTANAGINRRVRSEAERWFARMVDRDTNDPERAGFERWLSASPAHASAYREAERLWALTREAAKHPDVMTIANRMLQTALATTAWSPRRWLAPAMAAAVVLMVVVALGGWYAIALRPGSESYSTGIGQQRTVELKDGSAFMLDTDSVAVVRYGYRTRRVDLLRGRAEFRVQHNTDKPFVVHAGTGTVTAVGTKFQVSVGERDNVNVVLITGKVAIATGQSETTLTQGEALQFDRAGISRSAHPADLSTAEGWTHGEVVVHDWRLPRLLSEMNRYSTTKLHVGDASLRELRVTGTFPAGDQQTLMAILEAGWPIRVERMSATKVVLLHD